MHRASETIGAIAASLAKAQAELANPERTLTASFTDGHGREHDFRYASLLWTAPPPARECHGCGCC